jgi:hypothetical protein
VLLAIPGLVADAAVTAGDPAPDDVLKKRGLARSSMHYVLEGEAGFLEKVGKLQPSYVKIKAQYDDLFAIMLNQREHDQLNDEWTGVNERLRNVQAEIDTHPPLNNNVLRENWQNLLASERQLRFEYNRLNTEVNLRYRKLVPDSKREQLAGDFAKRRGDFLKEVRELRSLADKIKVRYAELSRDDAVKNALSALKRSTKARLDLGPSPEFKKKSAWLTSAEKATAPENLARRPIRKNATGGRSTKGAPKGKRNEASTSGTPATRPK